uniref:Uncharacterized protein n=1 Tax=Chromera velia CCMP2878 TaxID=1169474 RepID=A0A0G4HGD7_9ALVE|eukprot:Cvel_27176.t1-p1 / transcript=Cvel_27176.t1 / gene=Cvel_27176 / organism=Chromera_velia_CCMP2878 / gene_product=U3 small nucleolar RNA-interacting protein 2, putative / transcript_product=U3 small nucleolar RNA-interacting protein 2, putative / location=Cvel_scaffold3350:11443-14109(+) / protein_length=474 / sequence_SO=supercontig / SO=protein_coding / is_pseudo=false
MSSKRKAPGGSQSKKQNGSFPPKGKGKGKGLGLDEEIESDIDSDEIGSDVGRGKGGRPDEDSDENDFFETPAEKKVRLAKEHLQKIGAGEEDDDEVAARLQRDADLYAKKVHFSLGDELRLGTPSFHRGHKLTPTCIALSEDGRTAWTGGKDCAILQWDLETGRKIVFPGARNDFTGGGHFRPVLSLTKPEGSHLICSGGGDSLVRMWDTRQAGRGCVDSFKGHSEAVTGVVSEPGGTQQIFSCSSDKSLKVWSLSMRAYIDSHFGHTSGVNDMSILVRDRPVTVGDDRTARMWKVSAETHLVFPQTANGDCCTVLTGTVFASGCLDGSLSLWSHSQRKPLAVVQNAHGDEESSRYTGVCSLSCVPFSDVMFSGGASGVIKAWRSTGSKSGSGGESAASGGQERKPKGQGGSLTNVGEAPAHGFVNCLRVSKNGGVLAAVVGKEPREGRWEAVADAKNGLLLIPLIHSQIGKMS